LFFWARVNIDVFGITPGSPLLLCVASILPQLKRQTFVVTIVA
jgi:hypothetical protein